MHWKLCSGLVEPAFDNNGKFVFEILPTTSLFTSTSWHDGHKWKPTWARPSSPNVNAGSIGRVTLRSMAANFWVSIALGAATYSAMSEIYGINFVKTSL